MVCNIFGGGFLPGVHPASDKSLFSEAFIFDFSLRAELERCITEAADITTFWLCTFLLGILQESNGEMLGPIALLILDPLVVQFPANATDVAGTFDDGMGTAGNLVIQSGLSSVDLEPGTTLVAEPGNQIVIIDLPDGVPIPGTYDMTFTFQVTPVGPVQVKPMFTAKVVVDGQTFFPPIFPCVTDFASIPAIEIPVSFDHVDLLPVIANLIAQSGDLTCDGVVYDFTLISGAVSCDIDGDGDVDRNDIGTVFAARNTAAAPGDPRDANNDGVITVNDARLCVLECTNPRCAP